MQTVHLDLQLNLKRKSVFLRAKLQCLYRGMFSNQSVWDSQKVCYLSSMVDTLYSFWYFITITLFTDIQISDTKYHTSQCTACLCIKNLIVWIVHMYGLQLKNGVFSCTDTESPDLTEKLLPGTLTHISLASLLWTGSSNANAASGGFWSGSSLFACRLFNKVCKKKKSAS